MTINLGPEGKYRCGKCYYPIDKDASSCSVCEAKEILENKTPDELGELVSSMMAYEASLINSNGKMVQIQYLIEKGWRHDGES